MQYFEVFKEAFAPSNLRLEGAHKNSQYLLYKELIQSDWLKLI